MLSLGLGIGIRQYGSGFRPANLFRRSEQGAWYDPSDITTLFQDSAGTTPVTASGQPVGRMLDKSGRGNHATQATAAARPTYTTGGGLAWLAFDGVDDGMVTASITLAVDKVQVFAGARKTSDAATAVLVELSTSPGSVAGSMSLIFPFNATDRVGGRSSGTAFALTSTASATLNAPVTAVLRLTADIAADSLAVASNGVALASVATDQGTGNYTSNPLYIGRRAGTSNPFTGNLYGLIVRFGANLDAPGISNTERWMAVKSGVTI